MPRAVLALLLVAAVFFVFGRAGSFAFLVCDDPGYVVENPAVRSGLGREVIVYAFSGTHGGNWHPLTTLSHALDCQLFGLDPRGHHLGNVLLHALAAAVAFLGFAALTGALWTSLLAAALFALHPLRVESVAWVAERKDVLATLFWCLSTWAYAHAVHARNPGVRSGFRKDAGTEGASVDGSDAPHGADSSQDVPTEDTEGDAGAPRGRRGLRPAPVAVFLAAAAGLLSKPMLVTLPCALLLFDVWPLRRLRSLRELGPRLREKLPLFLLVAVVSVLTVQAQAGAGALGDFEGLSLGARLLHAPIAYSVYLEKTFWPIDLAVFYPHPGLGASGGSERLLPASLAVASLLGVSLLLVWWRRRAPFLLVGWCFFLGTLVPVLGLVQIGTQAYADRYTYIPHLGLFLVLAFGLRGIVEARPRLRAFAVPLAIGAVAAAATVTGWQLRWWENSVTLLQRAIAVTGENAWAEHNLGVALDGAGDTDAAIQAYERAASIRPGSARTRSNLGYLLFRRGRLEAAGAHLEAALRLDGSVAETHYHLGLVRQAEGRPAEARAAFEEAIGRAPGLAVAHNNLGAVLDRQGDPAAAAQHYAEALALDPAYTLAAVNLALVRMRAGAWVEAESLLVTALRHEPESEVARRSLAEVRRRREAAGD